MIEFRCKFNSSQSPLGPDRWISGVALETREDGKILVRSAETGEVYWLDTWAVKVDMRYV